MEDELIVEYLIPTQHLLREKNAAGGGGFFFTEFR